MPSVYDGRDGAEPGFTPGDRSLCNRRVIAFGAKVQNTVILGCTLTQNTTSCARYTEDPAHTDAP